MLSEGEDGRRKVETIVRLVQFSHRDTCSCHHPDRMRGDPEETSVISTGIREAHIEIPLVCRKDMKVGLHQFAEAALETKQDRIARLSRHVFRHRRQLLSNSDHTVRVLATVNGLHPLAFDMPSRESCGAIPSDSERIRRRSSESVLDGFHSMGCLLVLVNRIS